MFASLSERFFNVSILPTYQDGLFKAIIQQSVNHASLLCSSINADFFSICQVLYAASRIQTVQLICSVSGCITFTLTAKIFQDTLGKLVPEC